MANTKNTQKNTNKSTAKKTSSSGSNRSKRKSKGSSDDTMKFLLVLVIAGIAIALIFFSQGKEQDAAGLLTGTPTPTVKAEGETSGNAATQAPEGTRTPDREKEATPVPTVTSKPAEGSTATSTPAPTAPTSTPTPTVTPTPTPTFTPTPTPAPALTADEAETLVKSKVDTSMYSIQLLNDNLKVGNGRYYQFGVIYNQEFVSPFLVVDMVTGELYCYNSTEGTVYDFTPFPEKVEPTATPTPVPVAAKTLTAEEAYQVLCTYSKEALQTAKEVKEYDAEYGAELTLINGDNCYRINLFELANGKVRNRGEFYISEDGQKCYYIDSDTNEFVLVVK